MMPGEGDRDHEGSNRWRSAMGHDQDGSGLYPAGRLAEVAAAAAAAGLDALLLTPGPDLRYVTGYDAHQLERLTCLAVPVSGEPFLVVPRLEVPAAQVSPAGALDLEIVGWDEVMTRWKGRGPMNVDYVARLQKGYRDRLAVAA